MADIRTGKFWTDLLKKLLGQFLKSKGFSTRANTHNQHVVPHEDGWAIRGEGNERLSGVFNRQEQAIDRAREIALNYGSDVIIHREDGTIRDRVSPRETRRRRRR
ncbi:MAG: DUF2188 domain-containing protein [Flavobacteriales bacterium]|nr:DUF2188 domain-containing protein [Flavobacteriales bacterium]